MCWWPLLTGRLVDISFSMPTQKLWHHYFPLSADVPSSTRAQGSPVPFHVQQYRSSWDNVNSEMQTKQFQFVAIRTIEMERKHDGREVTEKTCCHQHSWNSGSHEIVHKTVNFRKIWDDFTFCLLQRGPVSPPSSLNNWHWPSCHAPITFHLGKRRVIK